MSLKTRFFSILTVAIAVAAFSTLTLAQDSKTTTPEQGVQKPDKADRKGRMHDGMGKDKRGEKFGRHGGGFHVLRGIELTDAQKGQIKAIRESNKPDAATIAELKAIHEARKAGTEITPEQKDRMKVLREQSRAKAKSVHEQIQGILTADQKAQIEAKKAEMKQRFDEHRQKRQQKPDATTTEKPKVS